MNIATLDFNSRISRNLPFEPSEHQKSVIAELSQFACREYPHQVFILKGYAGTGKTSLIASLVRTAVEVDRPVVLMAPTGRAAKIMSQYSGERASTIHKHIYVPRKKSSGGITFALKKNRDKHALYIIDEASMITDKSGESLLGNDSSLLDDLINYVKSGKNCALVLVGDTAQLPPVGYTDSPALSPRTFENGYDMLAVEHTLTQVYRQSADSAILANATAIRASMDRSDTVFGQLRFVQGKDFVRLEDGYDIQSAIEGAYSQAGDSETIIITRSNKRASQFNTQIRSRIKLSEGEIATGDILMVVKNNYFWVEEDSPCGFIANGDLVEVMSVRGIEQKYGMNFARVELTLVDYPLMPKFETIVMLDTLYSDTASLSAAQSEMFYQQVIGEYLDLPQYKRYAELLKNEYFNAIQVKFGYAVTCHKSQGGGWDHVFIEQVWMAEPKLSHEYLRWLYTAVTRAKEKVYMIGFGDEFWL